MTLRDDESTQNGYTANDQHVKPQRLVTAADRPRSGHRPRNGSPLPSAGPPERGAKTSHSAAVSAGRERTRPGGAGGFWPGCLGGGDRAAAPAACFARGLEPLAQGLLCCVLAANHRELHSRAGERVPSLW